MAAAPLDERSEQQSSSATTSPASRRRSVSSHVFSRDASPHSQHSTSDPNAPASTSSRAPQRRVEGAIRRGFDDAYDGNPPRPYKCLTPGCRRGFTNSNDLTYHRTRCPPDGVLEESEASQREDELKPFVCFRPDCAKRYKNRNGLKYHYDSTSEHGPQGLQLLATGAHPAPLYGTMLPSAKRKSVGSSTGSLAPMGSPQVPGGYIPTEQEMTHDGSRWLVPYPHPQKQPGWVSREPGEYSHARRFSYPSLQHTSHSRPPSTHQHGMQQQVNRPASHMGREQARVTRSSKRQDLESNADFASPLHRDRDHSASVSSAERRRHSEPRHPSKHHADRARSEAEQSTNEDIQPHLAKKLKLEVPKPPLSNTALVPAVSPHNQSTTSSQSRSEVVEEEIDEAVEEEENASDMELSSPTSAGLDVPESSHEQLPIGHEEEKKKKPPSKTTPGPEIGINTDGDWQWGMDDEGPLPPQTMRNQGRQYSGDPNVAWKCYHSQCQKMYTAQSSLRTHYKQSGKHGEVGLELLKNRNHPRPPKSKHLLLAMPPGMAYPNHHPQQQYHTSYYPRHPTYPPAYGHVTSPNPPPMSVRPSNKREPASDDSSSDESEVADLGSEPSMDVEEINDVLQALWREEGGTGAEYKNAIGEIQRVIRAVVVAPNVAAPKKELPEQVAWPSQQTPIRRRQKRRATLKEILPPAPSAPTPTPHMHNYLHYQPSSQHLIRPPHPLMPPPSSEGYHSVPYKQSWSSAPPCSYNFPSVLSDSQMRTRSGHAQTLQGYQLPVPRGSPVTESAPICRDPMMMLAAAATSTLSRRPSTIESPRLLDRCGSIFSSEAVSSPRDSRAESPVEQGTPVGHTRTLGKPSDPRTPITGGWTSIHPSAPPQHIPRARQVPIISPRVPPMQSINDSTPAALMGGPHPAHSLADQSRGARNSRTGQDDQVCGDAKFLKAPQSSLRAARSVHPSHGLREQEEPRQRAENRDNDCPRITPPLPSLSKAVTQDESGDLSTPLLVSVPMSGSREGSRFASTRSNDRSCASSAQPSPCSAASPLPPLQPITAKASPRKAERPSRFASARKLVTMSTQSQT